jgi:hypothetical protein
MWINKCKAVFKSKVDSMTATNPANGLYTQRGALKVIRRLQKGSGIPLTVLQRWYYEKEMERKTGKPFKTPLCIKCKIKYVRFTQFAVAPLKTGKYVGLCDPCVAKKQKEAKNAISLNSTKTDN